MSPLVQLRQIGHTARKPKKARKKKVRKPHHARARKPRKPKKARKPKKVRVKHPRKKKGGSGGKHGGGYSWKNLL